MLNFPVDVVKVMLKSIPSARWLCSEPLLSVLGLPPSFINTFKCVLWLDWSSTGETTWMTASISTRGKFLMSFLSLQNCERVWIMSIMLRTWLQKLSRCVMMDSSSVNAIPLLPWLVRLSWSPFILVPEKKQKYNNDLIPNLTKKRDLLVYQPAIKLITNRWVCRRCL